MSLLKQTTNISQESPPIIIGNGLNLPPAIITYLISMSLLIAGIGIFLQVARPFGIGSGMLSIQATSFVFPGIIISVGAYLLNEQGMTPDEMLSTILTVCFIGGLFVMLGSVFMKGLKKVITPTVSGITVMMIGLSLIKVGAVEFGGGFQAKAAGTFGELSALLLGTVTLIVIVLLNRSKNIYLRMGSLVIGMFVGFLVAIPLGAVPWEVLDSPKTFFVYPVPFKFGFFHFDLQAFLILFFPFLTVIVEAIGDLTATSAVSEEPISGPIYDSRIKGGILCDGFMTCVGACVGCFPVATFSQNNGIIQLSGVASRKVGRYAGIIFIIFALFPVVVIAFNLLPRPVLGGALLILFGTIAASGIRILVENGVDRRESIVIAVSLGIGVMCTVTPEAFANLPHGMRIFFESPIVAGGVSAMLINLMLPKKLGRSRPIVEAGK